MIGAVRGIDPETGHYFDDTRRYIDHAQSLSAQDRYQIYEGNARRVYPRPNALAHLGQFNQGLALATTGASA